MLSPAEVVRAAFVARGVGTMPSAAPWPIYVGSLPDDPDNAVCVYDTAGAVDGRIQRTGETIIHPGWQVRVRATDHTTGYTRATMLQKAMDAIRNFSVVSDGKTYTLQAITQSGGVLSLGQEPDAKRRNGFTFNGTLTLKEVP